MNKRGQLSFLKVIFFAMVFIVFFVFALAPLTATILGASNTSQFGTMGAWVVSNLNVWFFLAFALFVILALLYGIGND